MSMLKRLTVAACIAAITAAAFTAPASAAPDPSYVDTATGLTFTCSYSGTATITGYDPGSATTPLGAGLTVPGMLSATGVTTGGTTDCTIRTIGLNAFRSHGFTSVAIPYGVTDIQSNAFANNHLETVTFTDGAPGETRPSATVDLENSAFAGQTIDGTAVAGWTDDLDRLTRTVAGAGTWTAVTTPIHTVTLDYANSTANDSYLVLDGQTLGPDGISVLYDPYMDPQHPLIGWRYGADIPWNPANKVTQDVTLTAKWGVAGDLPDEFESPLPDWTVTFDPKNGGATITTVVKEGDPVGAPSAPTAPEDSEGTFQGWVDSAGSPWDFSTPVTQNLTLSAHWDFPTGDAFFDPMNAEIKMTEGNLFPGGTSTVELNLRFSDDTLKLLGLDTEEFKKFNQEHEEGRFLFVRRGSNIVVGGCFVPQSEYLGTGLIDLWNQDPGCRTPEPATVVVPPREAVADEAGCKPQQVLGQYFYYLDVCLYIQSDPRFLTAGTIDPTGKGTFTFTLPEDFPPGEHTLVFSVAGEEVTLPVTVAPALASTGPDDAVMLGNAAAMSILFGLYLVFLGRSRKRGLAGGNEAEGLA